MPRGALVLAVLSAALLASGATARGNMEPPQQLNNPDVALYPQPESENAMFEDLNAERRRNGLPALALDRELRAIARDYAQQMLHQHFIGHVDPSGSGPGDRLRRAHYGFRHAAENLIYSTGDEPEAFAHLLASPGHQANMLDARVTRVGVGAVSSSVYSTMYVQEFAGD